MVKHVVMFKLDGDSAAVAKAAADFKAGLEALPAQIAELKSMEVAVDNSGIEGNWTVTLTALCDNFDDLKAYAGHPAHLACVAIIKPIVAARACVDCEQ